MLSKNRVKNLIFNYKEKDNEKLSVIHDNNSPSLYGIKVIDLFDENKVFEDNFNDEVLRPNQNLEQVVVEDPDTEIRNIIRYKCGRKMNANDCERILNYIENSFYSIRDNYQGPSHKIPRYIYAIPTKDVIKYTCLDEISNNCMVDVISNYDEELEIVPTNLIN